MSTLLCFTTPPQSVRSPRVGDHVMFHHYIPPDLMKIMEENEVPTTEGQVAIVTKVLTDELVSLHVFVPVPTQPVVYQSLVAYGRSEEHDFWVWPDDE